MAAGELLRPCCKTAAGGMMAGHERLIPCPRRPVGSHRASAAEGAAEAEGRSPADPGPRRPRRHRLRPADGLSRGGCCRRNLAAAAARPAGDDSVTGRKPASGQRLHETLLNWLGDEAAIDWSRASVDSLERPRQKGGDQTGPNPVDRGKLGSKYHLVVDRTRHSAGGPASRRPTPTTPRNCSRSSMPSRRSSARVASRADRASVRPNSTPTRPTIPRIYGVRCALGASPLGSRAAGSTPPTTRTIPLGGGALAWPGCWAVAASGCATSGGRTCSKGCSTWPVR